MLHVRSSFRDGADLEMAEAIMEDGGRKEPASPSSADVEGAYAVVAGAMEKFCTIVDRDGATLEVFLF